MTTYILSQIFVCISTIIFITSLQFKTKKKILVIQFFSAVCFSTHYFLLGSILGGCFTIIEILRLLTFYSLESSVRYNNNRNNLIAGISYSVIFSVTSIITWNAWFCIFILVSAIIVSLAFAQKNVIVLKFSFLFQSACTIVYLALLNSPFGAISQTCVLLGSLIGIILMYKSKKSPTEVNCVTKNTIKIDIK